MRLVIFSPFDDIKEDGTAIFWRMKEGACLNEQYNCRCIWEMLTAKELFDVIWSQLGVEVDQARVERWCQLVE